MLNGRKLLLGATTLVVALLLAASTAMADQTVTLRLVDQGGTEIPASQIVVNGNTVPTGGSIVLAETTHSFSLQPGLNGFAQGGARLARSESATVGATTMELVFEWITADLTVHIVDQGGVEIPASQFNVVYGSGVLPSGTTVANLPITDVRMTRFWITLQQGADFVISSIKTMRGGEIFVPKIPSMKITDLARCLAPDLPHEIIGIRPGEKLHEVLITEDDSPNTYELKDRFITEPAFPFWTRDPVENGVAELEDVRPVAEDFRYASNNNTQWLDEEGLREYLSGPR